MYEVTKHWEFNHWVVSNGKTTERCEDSELSETVERLRKGDVK